MILVEFSYMLEQLTRNNVEETIGKNNAMDDLLNH